MGFGLGLRPDHYFEILNFLPQSLAGIDWFEALSENYMGLKGPDLAGRPLEMLLKVRAQKPVVLHGVSMNLGGIVPLDFDYLKKLRDLKNIVQVPWVSDHLCFTGAHGENLHDLLPLPYTEESLLHLCTRITEVQEYLGCPLLIENVSSYLSYTYSEMTEWNFLSELVKRTGAYLLLDINNVYVSSVNHSFNAEEFLNSLPADRVLQIHLAGHTKKNNFLIDTHDHPICDEVLLLYKNYIQKNGARATMVEWDAQIPSFAELRNELFKAKDTLSINSQKLKEAEFQ